MESDKFKDVWFALCSNGRLVEVGKYADHGSAEKAASSLGLDVVWLVLRY